MAPSYPLITPAPQLEERQAAANFMGWEYDTDIEIYTQDFCNTNLTFNIGATYVGCCATTTICNLPGSCSDGTLFYTNSGSTTSIQAVPCTAKTGSFSVCGTLQLYEYSGASTYKTEFFCAVSSTTHVLYRSEPTTTTSSDLLSFTPFSFTPFSYPTPTDYIPPSSSYSYHESKAWIAGAVLGPLLGVPIIGAFIIALLLLTRKRHNANAAQQQPQQPPQMENTNQYPPPGVEGYVPTKPVAQNPPISPVNQGAYHPQYNYNTAPPASGLAAAPHPGPAPYPEPYPAPHSPPGSPPPMQVHTPELHHGQHGSLYE